MSLAALLLPVSINVHKQVGKDIVTKERRDSIKVSSIKQVEKQVESRK